MKDDSSIVKVVKKVLPSVVSITVSKYLEFFESSPSGPFGFQGFRGFLKRKKTKVGGGSGFIIDSNGIILTNRHVVEDPNAEYVVMLQNGKKFKPEILARDPINDIAVLKINSSTNSEKLSAIKFGDSSKVELGQTVIAIGNALGLFRNTVSSGIISGLSREITAQSDFSKEKTKLRGLMQTDAAINPGNSGGPLIDISGSAVGINSATVFGAENISFALPINNAKKDFEELKEYGRIRQPFLGLRYLLLDDEIKNRFGLPVNFGALVIAEPIEPGISIGFGEAVIPNSPAHRAGIRESDIILEFANKKITQKNTLSDVLVELEIGTKLPLKVLRNGTEKNLKIVLGEKN